MVPSSAASVAVFLLFVVPGTCYELLRNRTLLPVEESAFLQISRILLSGTLFTTISILLIILTKWISPRALLDPFQLLTRGSVYVDGNLGLVTKTIVLQLLVAILLAATAADLRLSNRSVRIHRGTALLGVAEIELPDTAQSYLCVHLKSGREIFGYYYGATTDLEAAKRELILQPPIQISKDGEKPALAPSHWQRIVIPGSETEYVSVAYVDTYVKESPTIARRAQSAIAANYPRARVCAPAILALLIAACIPFHG
ncbi:MAG: hypothetical protein JWQ81_6134 [Amycolatopsis sp.]|uniref:DUF6338 family protein n=1 Tax=Amycolatopsis sp. TaxID=37632 RepID=UPI003459ADFE|nr:hypothetical protein [Amycolatopsis sp.]